MAAFTGKGDPSIGVTIQPSIHESVWNVYVFRRLGNNKISMLSIAHVPKDGDGGFLYKWGDEVSQFEPRNPAPTFQLPIDWAPHVAKAFIDQGFEVPSESFLKGQVDATQRHLDDMRRLVFEKKS